LAVRYLGDGNALLGRLLRDEAMPDHLVDQLGHFGGLSCQVNAALEFFDLQNNWDRYYDPYF
jgi:hypothetical protein